VVELVRAKKLQPCLTEEVLAEYHRVFEYDRLRHLDRRRIARLRGSLEVAAIKVKSGGRLKISGHESDNRIYECAVAAKANYIITENTKHFPQPHKFTKIITARQLLKLLGAEQV
jgi:predicted nucleic acid-binding protein